MVGFCPECCLPFPQECRPPWWRGAASCTSAVLAADWTEERGEECCNRSLSQKVLIASFTGVSVLPGTPSSPAFSGGLHISSSPLTLQLQKPGRGGPGGNWKVPVFTAGKQTFCLDLGFLLFRLSPLPLPSSLSLPFPSLSSLLPLFLTSFLPLSISPPSLIQQTSSAHLCQAQCRGHRGDLGTSMSGGSTRD